MITAGQATMSRSVSGLPWTSGVRTNAEERMAVESFMTLCELASLALV